MAFEGLLDRIEEGGDARSLLRPVKGAEGVCAAYFGRLGAVYGGDPSRAKGLARHWRAFLDLGDDQALAYRAKGAAERLDGRWMASARAFLKAGELATDEIARLSHPIGAIDGLAKAGRVDEAVALGRRLAEGLDAHGATIAAARARLNAANALVWGDRAAEAGELFRRAIPVFATEGLRMEESAARLGLCAAHLYGGDPSIAEREAAAAKAIAEEAGIGFIATACDLNLAHLALVRGRADEAFASLLEIRPRLEGHHLARAEASIGDACLRLNLRPEAAAAYAAALAGELAAIDRAHVLFGLGEARREPETLARAAARYRALGNHPWQAAALAARVAHDPSARGALRLADKAVEAAEGSSYHTALALLARAEARLARRLDASADLREAERTARRYGYRRFAWRIHALRARSSAAPLPHFRRMLDEILRERLANTSVAARAGFLEDKSAALGAYLAHLLSNPTPRRVAEAREAIRRTRAATLLDEIVNSGSLRLDETRSKRLEELRAQVVQDAAEEPAPDARGGALTHPERRGWTEASHVLGALDAALPPAVAEGCVLLAEADGELWAIAEEHAIRLRMSARELEESLRWLHFELHAPTADRDAPADEAMAILGELREALVEPWWKGPLSPLGERGRGEGSQGVRSVAESGGPLTPNPSPPEGRGEPLRLCPDGLLWRVPWNALFDETPTLMLHPSLAGGGQVGEIRKVAVWIDAPADLPNAPVEERTLCARFPQARVMRSRKEVLESLHESWDLVHVVGHARHNPGNPMFSALEFGDGPIYAAEIARSGLRTRLACLSACETGTLSFENRGEPDGLVRAFLARGAEGVLASLWPLDDESASLFFRCLYTNLKPCDDLPKAVGEARRAVRDWRGHPYFWASLSLFGGYRP